MRYAEFIDAIEGAAADFARLIASAPRDTPVPTCPGWTLEDLTQHLGTVHRWARGHITGSAESDGRAMPVAGGAVGWFEDGAADLVGALRERAPDTPCWTLYPPAMVETWARRQALETTLHLWDAGNALERSVDIPTALAVAGVAEVIDDMYPRQVGLGRVRPLESAVEIRLAAAGPHSRTTFRLGGEDGGGDERGGDERGGTPLAEIEIGAVDALLLLWKRRSLDSIPHRITGSAEVLDAALSTALVP